MIDPELLRQAHRLLNQARLIAEAPASQAGQIGLRHPQSHAPPGLVFTAASVTHNPSTLDQFGARINLAIAHDSDAELHATNRWCEDELQHLQHGAVVVPETEREFSARICRDYEGVIAPVVARAERTYVRRVRDARVADQRDARMGHKLKGLT